MYLVAFVAVVMMPCILAVDTSIADIQDQDYLLREQSLNGNDNFCQTVCMYCRTVLSMRWAALCFGQCGHGGRAYDACLTAWTIREEFHNVPLVIGHRFGTPPVPMKKSEE